MLGSLVVDVLLAVASDTTKVIVILLSLSVISIVSLLTNLLEAVCLLDLQSCART